MSSTASKLPKRFKDGQRMVEEATLRMGTITFKVNISKEKYGLGGGLALIASMAEGEAVGGLVGWLSVNIVKDCTLTSDKLPKDHCYFKTWSENEGFLEQLVEQGIVKRLGVCHQKTGAPIVKVLF